MLFLGKKTTPGNIAFLFFSWVCEVSKSASPFRQQDASVVGILSKIKVNLDWLSLCIVFDLLFSGQNIIALNHQYVQTNKHTHTSYFSMTQLDNIGIIFFNQTHTHLKATQSVLQYCSVVNHLCTERLKVTPCNSHIPLFCKLHDKPFGGRGSFLTMKVH